MAEDALTDLQHAVLELTAQLDIGFTTSVRCEMLATHRRFTDQDFVKLGADPPQLRESLEQWRTSLERRQG
jgi:hypothetical protein